MRHRASSSLVVATALLLAVAGATASACGDDGGLEASPTEVSATPVASPTSQPETRSGGWPMLGHDLSSSFHNPDESLLSTANVAELDEAWELEAIGSVNGAAAVVGDRVYVLAGGAAYGLDAATGEPLWRNSDVGGTSSPAYSDGTLYVTTAAATLHALDADSGNELWQAEIDPHPQAAGFSSPVVAGELVIVGSSSTEEFSASGDATFRGGVVAFGRGTGDEVWRHYTVEPPFNGVAVWSSVSVDMEAGVVFGTTGNNYTGDASDTSDSIFALELETGELVWNTQLTEGDVFIISNPRSEDTDFGTNPILFDATLDGELRKLIGAGQKSGMFWALDRGSGEVMWSRQVSDGSALIGGVFNNGAFDGERLIMAGNDGTSDGPGSEPANGESEPFGGADVATSVLMALDPADGSILWERQLPAWVWAPITIANGVGFVSAESELQAFNVATGEKLFAFKTDGTITSGASVAGGRVFFGSGLAYFGTAPGNTFHALGLP